MKGANGTSGKRKFGIARAVCTVGLMAASIECGKLVLAALPNIEVVTLLCAIYGYVFGWMGILAAVIFVLIEPLIYGFGPWVITYFIYWPLVAGIFMLLGRLRVNNRVVLTAAALVLTLFFGVLSSFVDVGLFSGRFDNILARFAVYYARGGVFYIIQLACNAVLFPLLFRPLSTKLYILK